MKPYKLVPIRDCGEPLVPISADLFAFVHPHPYEKVGAPYNDKSPFYLRQSVLERLIVAQLQLRQVRSAWTIQIFDAYRPLAVQHYMVDYTFAEVVEQRGQTLNDLTEADRQEILELVYEFWAVPDHNPDQPPPHSTGGAVDVTLVDGTGAIVDMGSPIDELSSRSYPHYYADSTGAAQQTFHRNRQILSTAMTGAGFMPHWGEWWHFCYGDQMWAWLTNRQNPDISPVAFYGRVE